jgi:hypothetical protein
LTFGKILMKAFILICAAFFVMSPLAVAASTTDDTGAVEFAAAVAKKFLSALDRKQAHTAEQHSYIAKRDGTRGAVERVPLVSEGVLKIRIEAREKFGKLLSRDLVQTTVAKTHHNLPDSKFVEFRYQVRFEKKEKVTEMLKVKVEGEQRGKVVSFASI